MGMVAGAIVIDCVCSHERGIGISGTSSDYGGHCPSWIIYRPTNFYGAVISLHGADDGLGDVGERGGVSTHRMSSWNDALNHTGKSFQEAALLRGADKVHWCHEKIVRIHSTVCATTARAGR